MIKYIISLIVVASCVGCSSTHNREKLLLIEAIKENMESQVLINEVAIENWKKVQSGYRSDVQPAENATKNLTILKNKIFTDSALTTNDFKIQEMIDAYSEFKILDTIIEYKENLTISEKIKLFTLSYELTSWLTSIKRGSYCGFTIFDEKYYILPPNEKNAQVLITYLEPQETKNGEIIFHQKNGEKTTQVIPTIYTEKTPWIVAIPNKELLMIEWTDSMNGYKRQFTWPNYNPYLP